LRKVSKRVLVLVIILLLVTGGTTVFANGNYETATGDAEKVQAQQTKVAMRQAQNMVGAPAIKNYTDRKDLKMIYELRDQADLICYAYFVTLNGDLVFFGKTKGFGIPYSTQYTNPYQIKDNQHGSYEADSVLLPQADPNALYQPTTSSATWLIMFDPETNEPKPIYVEPLIIVSPFKLK